jgi:hypothetical protein
MRPVWQVGAIVAVVHLLWIGAYFAAGHEARDFIKIGVQYVSLSHTSRVIKYDPSYRYPTNHAGKQGRGYDGQWSYYMALDPVHARYYMDDPAYRYGRILYPVAARALALGRPGAIPYTMLAINVLAIVGGSLALGAWLEKRGHSPWLALLYGLFPGLLLALERDLTEPLGYGLVALAVYLFDFGGRRGVLTAGAVFGLAGLARETTVIFPVLFGISILAGRPNASGIAFRRGTRWRLAAGVVLLGVLPIVAWTGVVWAIFGSLGAGRHYVGLVPFGGLLDHHAWSPVGKPVVVGFIVVPALIWALVAAGRLKQNAGRLEMTCVIANVLLATVFAGPSIMEAYTSAGRASTGVVLSAVLCVPYLVRQLPRRALSWLAAACGLWLVIFPVVVAYGFSNLRA